MRGFGVLLLLVFSGISGFARDLTRYVLVLNDAPASAAGGRSAMAARLRNIEAHTPVRNWLIARDFHVTTETHILLNAIFVAADSTRASRFRWAEARTRQPGTRTST